MTVRNFNALWNPTQEHGFLNIVLREATINISFNGRVIIGGGVKGHAFKGITTLKKTFFPTGGGGKALMARPLRKNNFFAASL